MIEIRQYCTFFINDFYFGIDINQVQEVIRSSEVTPVPLAPSDICGLINLRGKIVTVIDLKCRLGMDRSLLSSASRSELDEEFLSHNIIVQTKDEIAGLLVEDIGDMLEFTSDRFESSPATLTGKMRKLLRGAYSLSQGFLMILDIEKVFKV